MMGGETGYRAQLHLSCLKFVAEVDFCRQNLEENYHLLVFEFAVLRNQRLHSTKDVTNDSMNQPLLLTSTCSEY